MVQSSALWPFSRRRCQLLRLFSVSFRIINPVPLTDPHNQSRKQIRENRNGVRLAILRYSRSIVLRPNRSRMRISCPSAASPPRLARAAGPDASRPVSSGRRAVSCRIFKYPAFLAFCTFSGYFAFSGYSGLLRLFGRIGITLVPKIALDSGCPRRCACAAPNV